MIDVSAVMESSLCLPDVVCYRFQRENGLSGKLFIGQFGVVCLPLGYVQRVRAFVDDVHPDVWQRLEGAYRCRAYGGYLLPGFDGGDKCVDEFASYAESLCVHGMAADFLRFHRLESPGTDMQGHMLCVNVLVAQCVERCGGEVQAWLSGRLPILLSAHIQSGNHRSRRLPTRVSDTAVLV